MVTKEKYCNFLKYHGYEVDGDFAVIDTVIGLQVSKIYEEEAVIKGRIVPSFYISNVPIKDYTVYLYEQLAACEDEFGNNSKEYQELEAKIDKWEERVLAYEDKMIEEADRDEW